LPPLRLPLLPRPLSATPKLTVAAVIAIVYTVGLVGLALPASHAVFLQLVPLNLLFSLGLLLYYQQGWNKRTVAATAAIALFGYLIEVLGVHTGLIFGRYAYGPTLGPQLVQVPLLIGVNWVIVVLCAMHAVRRLPLPAVAQVALAALLLTALDALIEPIAISQGYWHWYGQPVPLRNYIGWAGTSAALCAFIGWRGPQGPNPVALPLLICQALFFALLNIWQGLPLSPGPPRPAPTTLSFLFSYLY
jgi:bisanhydrobacterioruberin hydratase